MRWLTIDEAAAALGVECTRVEELATPERTGVRRGVLASGDLQVQIHETAMRGLAASLGVAAPEGFPGEKPRPWWDNDDKPGGGGDAQELYRTKQRAVVGAGLRQGRAV